MMLLLMAVGFLLFLAACFWLLFARHPKRTAQDEAEEADERNRMIVAMKAFETGKSVLGTVGDDGKLSIRVLGDEQRRETMAIRCEFCDDEVSLEEAHEIAGFDGEEAAFACGDCYNADTANV
jgi:hypothetical protein